MDIVILTREYPPYIYGGAGVHVEYLTRELAALDGGEHRVRVFCFGDQNEIYNNLEIRGVESGSEPPFQDERHRGFMKTLQNDVLMIGSLDRADIIHCHTWYSHLAGTILRQLTGAPLVLTTHSLEPHRPWKQEQLGTAYRASSWIEKTAYQNSDGVIAVSRSMKNDVKELYNIPEDKIQVIHNGIDSQEYRLNHNENLIKSYGIDPSIPFTLFVGRITRQKGIIHLVNAVKYIQSPVQVVLCAGAPDTDEILRDMEKAVESARRGSTNRIIWIPRILPRSDIITMYSHASIFVCPSVYEPFGIINLEAMACETAVVASAVGGIPEIVVPDETGVLVVFKPVSDLNFEPEDPVKYSRDLAQAVDRLLSDPDRLKTMGIKARQRVEDFFSWQSIARRTLDFYRHLISSKI
jgi:starch synthase